MAVHARKLDTKARTAIAVVVAVLLAGPLYVTAKLVAAKLAGTDEVVHPADDQLVLMPDGSTMLVRHGSTGRILADWLKQSPGGVRSFEVGNDSFEPGSATPTREGWEHLAQFAQMLRAYHQVSAVVLYTARHGVPATTELEQMRAMRIHDEAVRQGVDAHQIAVAPEGFEAGHNAAADEGLEVVVMNRA